MTFRDPRVLLKAHGLWTKKRFGQNFLIDPTVPERIARAGGVSGRSKVVEIGSGCGTLTQVLGESGAAVIALEYDRDLIPVARAELAQWPQVEVREANVLDTVWPALADELGGPLLIYGNLPYHLSSPIIFGLLEVSSAWERACFMVQREFAQRLVARPGERAAGSLSVHAALWTQSTMLFEVPPESFYPSPKVHSAVVVIERRAKPAVHIDDQKTFNQLVKTLFAQRRKMSRKTLKLICEDVPALLDAAGVDGMRRGEEFELWELAELANALTSLRRAES